MKAAIAPEKLAAFRARLPRLADLHDRFNADQPNNFFRYFQNWFDESEVTLSFYDQIERNMSFIPHPEWGAFAAKVGLTVNCCDKKNRRDWEQLFNVFNEALGARVLVENYGCDSLKLISAPKKGKACDWSGSASGKLHYLEVKTLNHSDEERKSWYGEAQLVHTTRAPAALLAKAISVYNDAKVQLDAMPMAAAAKKLVLFVVNADHNFDPMSENTVRELLLEEFGKFEDENYCIHLDIITINDD